jgi:opacity protein-like surface antigen
MVVGHVGVAEAGTGKTLRGDGIEIGATAVVRPFSGARRLAIEADLSAFRQPRESAGQSFSKEMSAQQFAVRASYVFRREGARARPYLFGGLAVIRVDYESQCIHCVFDVDPVTLRLISRGIVTERITDTSAGFTLGAGMDIGVTQAVILRPEWSSSSTTPGGGWNWYWGALRLGVGYRF